MVRVFGGRAGGQALAWLVIRTSMISMFGSRSVQGDLARKVKARSATLNQGAACNAVCTTRLAAHPGAWSCCLRCVQHLAGSYVLLVSLLGVLTGRALNTLPFALFGAYFSWVYLRFWQARGDGSR